MSWEVAPLWAATALYTLQVGACLAYARYPQALIMVGYVAANLGLLWSMPR